MILVVGGIGSGKRAYAHKLGYSDDCIAEGVGQAAVLAEAQGLVRDPACDVDRLSCRIAAEQRVVLCDEVGSGIVPLDAAERAWRDRVGQLCRALAARADSVVRMVCGVPTAVKGVLPFTQDCVQVVIMRHGQTTANVARQYSGSHDVELTELGEQQARDAGVCPGVSEVYVSPLKRARRTAELCFPGARQQVVDDLREMNFGDFELRSAADMEHDPAYREWVDSYCTLPCPGGECRDEFTERVAGALADVVRDAIARGRSQAIVVAHGGTIMAAMHACSEDERDYFAWAVGNCQGYRAWASFAEGRLSFAEFEQVARLDFIGDGDPGSQDRPYAAHLFFSNRACRYFPCHKGIDERDFNCLYCYCPLYALGPDCGGDFTYTESGRKNCTGCVLPHRRDTGAKLIASHYGQLADLASRPERS